MAGVGGVVGGKWRQLYWNNNTKVKKIKCAMSWFDICVHCEGIPHIELMNTCITSNIYPSFFFWSEAFFAISKFLLYNTVLPVIVTMFCTKSSDLIHHVTESLCSFTSAPLFSLSQSLATTFLLSLSLFL